MRLVFLSNPPPLLFRDGDLPVPSGPPLPADLVRRLPQPPRCPLRQHLDLVPLQLRKGRHQLGGPDSSCFCCCCRGCLGGLLDEQTRRLQDCGLGRKKKKTRDNYCNNLRDNLAR